MNILQLCNKLPYPEKDGGAIAISSLTNSLLAAGCKVKMLAMNTPKHFIDINTIPEEQKGKVELEVVNIDTSVKPFNALWALITGQSYNVSRFYSNDYKNKLEAILKGNKYDIIQLEGLYLAPYIHYIRALSSAKIVLRAHNVEWMIWDKLAKESKGLKKIYLSSLTKSLKAYEAKAINECDAITVFTQNDKKQLLDLGCKVPVQVFPFGVDLRKYVPSSNTQQQSLFFIGALDWMPNLQGLEWFLTKVWNKVHSAYPNIEFHVAGRKMPDSLLNSKYPNVHFHGEVGDALSFIKEHGIMLSPLFAGSGIRIKIIEGMALGKTVISTTIGAQGIDCMPGKEILIANTSEDFFLAVKSCIDNPALVKSISQSSRSYIEAAHDIRTITTKLLEFYNSLIKGQIS